MENLLNQVDHITAIRIYKKLLNKGFKRVIYKEQEQPNIWYRIEFTEENIVERFIEALKESKGYWEYRFDNMIIFFEIREDLNYSQYLITEQKRDFGREAWDELTIDEFEKILDLMDNSEVVVGED